MKFIAAKCPSCGAGIQVPDNKDFAFCTFCGSNVKVRESVIMKSDVDTDNLLSLGYVEIQAKDYNEAMDYFTRVLDLDGKNSKAWMGKGCAVIRKSNTELKKYEEALVYFRNALQYCDDKEKEALTDAVIAEYTEKKFYNGHIEFLDTLIKLRPHKTHLFSLITLIKNLEDLTAKSGNKISRGQQVIKENALALLQEIDPGGYENHLKNLQGRDKQHEINIRNKFEERKKQVFSGKRMVTDTIASVFLNPFIAAVILIAINAAEDTFGRGVTTFLSIFLVLIFFSHVAMYFAKRKEVKRIEEEYAARHKDI